MPDFEALEFTEVDVTPVTAVQLAGQCPPDPASIAAAIGPAFHTAMEFVATQQLMLSAPPRTIYQSFTAEGVSYAIAFPVFGDTALPEDCGFTVGQLPGGRAYRFTHRSAYSNLRETYGKIDEFVKEKGWVKSERDWARFMPMWEEYINNPDRTPEAELITYIYMPAAQA